MDKGHGRVETRKLWALPVTPEEAMFSAAEQVIRIERTFDYVRSGHHSEETVYAISSLTPSPDSGANAEILLEIVRGHWSIECNHHVRDRTYDEDRCQVRNPNSARILATLRSTARFLAKQNAHRPRNAHQATTPGLNRFCDAYRNKTIGWIMKPKGFI